VLPSDPQPTRTRVDLTLAHELNKLSSVVLKVVFFNALETHLETIIKQESLNEAQELTVSEESPQKFPISSNAYFLLSWESC
jgi:hypothetical protein